MGLTGAHGALSRLKRDEATFTALTRELQLKGVTLERLRWLFLGSKSEKTKKVLGDDEKKKSVPDSPPARTAPT